MLQKYDIKSLFQIGIRRYLLCVHLSVLRQGFRPRRDNHGFTVPGEFLSTAQ